MIYTASDLHGYPLSEFQKLLEKAGFSDSDYCFILGDVIDRGKEGVKILQWLMVQPNIELILGNHEAMMLACEFLFDEITDEAIDELSVEKMGMYSNWMANGGADTLTALKDIREEAGYIYEYLKEAPLYEALNINGRKFVLTHSGLGSFDKNKSISDYTEEDLLWNRPSLEQRYFDDITVVFGHTPTLFYGDEFKGKAIVTDTWINIDAGVACGSKPMLLRLDDLKEFYLD